jgi:8-hydroxy-5-deazaflavin:NADPH oxidoreductase
VKVAIVGGTGKFGLALAAQLRETDDVVIGSRDPERAREAAKELGVEGAANEDAVRGVDLVVLAVKATTALETARGLREAIGGTPVLSVASDLHVHERSLAEQIAGELDAPVAAGLHTIAAATMGSDQDALICGDDEETKALALELAGRVVAGRVLDAGPLETARALEGLTGVIVALNRRYRAHAGIRLTGL